MRLSIPAKHCGTWLMQSFPLKFTNRFECVCPFQLNAVAHDWCNLSLWNLPIALNEAMHTTTIKAILFLICPTGSITLHCDKYYAGYQGNLAHAQTVCTRLSFLLPHTRAWERVSTPAHVTRKSLRKLDPLPHARGSGHETTMASQFYIRNLLSVLIRRSNCSST